MRDDHCAQLACVASCVALFLSTTYVRIYIYANNVNYTLARSWKIVSISEQRAALTRSAREESSKWGRGRARARAFPPSNFGGAGGIRMRHARTRAGKAGHKAIDSLQVHASCLCTSGVSGTQVQDRFFRSTPLNKSEMRARRRWRLEKKDAAGIHDESRTRTYMYIYYTYVCTVGEGEKDASVRARHARAQ